jgi:hypothetical protein
MKSVHNTIFRSPQQSGYTQTQQTEDPVKLLQVRLAKGENYSRTISSNLKDAAGRLKEKYSLCSIPDNFHFLECLCGTDLFHN